MLAEPFGESSRSNGLGTPQRPPFPPFLLSLTVTLAVSSTVQYRGHASSHESPNSVHLPEGSVGTAHTNRGAALDASKSRTHEVYADGADVAVRESVISETQQEARLAHARIPDKHELEQMVAAKTGSKATAGEARHGGPDGPYCVTLRDSIPTKYLYRAPTHTHGLGYRKTDHKAPE